MCRQAVMRIFNIEFDGFLIKVDFFSYTYIQDLIEACKLGVQFELWNYTIIPPPPPPSQGCEGPWMWVRKAWPITMEMFLLESG